MSEFKAGDRVRTKHYGDRTVVGRCHTWPDSYVLEAVTAADEIVERDIRFVSLKPSALTLIPDTVTVTVELTREQATAAIEKWGGRSDDPDSLAMAAAGVVKDAIREALA